MSTHCWSSFDNNSTASTKLSTIETNAKDDQTGSEIVSLIGLGTSNIVPTKTAFANKVDKITGKGLSANDFTNTYKGFVDANNNKISYRATDSNKLAGIEMNATRDQTASEIVTNIGSQTGNIVPTKTAFNNKVDQDVQDEFELSVATALTQMQATILFNTNANAELEQRVLALE